MINLSKSYNEALARALEISKAHFETRPNNLNGLDLKRLNEEHFGDKYGITAWVKLMMLVTVFIRRKNYRLAKLVGFDASDKTIRLLTTDGTEVICNLNTMYKLNEFYGVINDPERVLRNGRVSRRNFSMTWYKIVNATISSAGIIKERKPSISRDNDISKFDKIARANVKAGMLGSGMKLMEKGVRVNSIGAKADKQGTYMIPKVVAESLGDGGLRHSLRNNNDVTTVIFQGNPTTIPEAMCYGCAKVEEVQLPKSVNTIEKFAFYGCANLKHIELHEGIVSIGTAAFSNCGLRHIVTPKTLRYLGHRAFYENKDLRSLRINTGIGSLPEGLLDGCVKLTELFIPKSVTKVDPNLFSAKNTYSNRKGANLCTITAPKHLAEQLYKVTMYCNYIKEIKYY